MKLSIEELKMVVKEAAKKAKKIKKSKDTPKKGRDGYESDPSEQPKGWKKSEMADLSKPQGNNNVVKQQGNSNMGPWTNESALKALIGAALKEEFEPKVETKSADGDKDELEDVKIPKNESIWESLKFVSEAFENASETKMRTPGDDEFFRDVGGMLNIIDKNGNVVQKTKSLGSALSAVEKLNKKYGNSQNYKHTIKRK